MPELPDLQVFSYNLNKELAGKTLKKIEVFKNAKVNVAEKDLKRSLEKQKLSAVYREGKELRFAFQNKIILGIHLMLRGKLSWIDEEKNPPNTLLRLSIGDKELILTDYQYNARITLNPEPSDVPDALSSESNVAFWKEKLKSRAAIKNLLLDQHVIRGIGNAYADEILWKAGISPFSVGNKIPPNKIKKLVKSIKNVLEDAERQLKKKDPDIIGGEVRDFLKIHNSKKKTSPAGAPIKIKKAGARKTYYTDEQELFK